MNETSLFSGEEVQEILAELGILFDSVDVLLVGDGSGSRWGYPGGWAVHVFDNLTMLKKTLYGAFNDTTVNICELLPYLYGMQWYVRGPGAALQRKLREADVPRSANVLILTDCEVIANQGNHLMARDANGALWAAMDHYARLNYDLTYRWIPRGFCDANEDCDRLSKAMRLLITDFNPSQPSNTAENAG